MWGRADCSPTVCILSGLSDAPSIEADDIPIVSVGNTKDIDTYIKKSAKYTYFTDKEDVQGVHDAFIKHFRRMITRLEKDPDTEKEGLITEFGTINVKTSPDNEILLSTAGEPLITDLFRSLCAFTEAATVRFISQIWRDGLQFACVTDFCSFVLKTTLIQQRLRPSSLLSL